MTKFEVYATMRLNLRLWINGLDHFNKQDFEEGCLIMFALADKVAKARYSRIKGNRARMTRFFNDEVKHILLLGTGYDIEYLPVKIIEEDLSGNAVYDEESKTFCINDQSVGDIMFKIRCSIMHEAEEPADVELNREFGILQFTIVPKTSKSPEKIFFSRQFCEYYAHCLTWLP